MNLYKEMNEKIVGLLRINDENPVCAYASDRIEALEAENGKLREGLRKLEWSKSGKVGGGGYCPACNNHKAMSGHSDSCWLAALLKETE